MRRTLIVLLALGFMTSCTSKLEPVSPWPSIAMPPPVLRIAQDSHGLFIVCERCPAPTPKSAWRPLSLQFSDSPRVASRSAAERVGAIAHPMQPRLQRVATHVPSSSADALPDFDQVDRPVDDFVAERPQPTRR